MAGHFLPFTPNGKATELKAIAVKERLGLGPDDCVDPVAVLPSVPARLVETDTISRLLPGAADVLFRSNRDDWSAVGLFRSPATKEWLILLNPTHHRHRQRVSLMEEEVHIILDHPRTELRFDNSRWMRPYHSDAEDEAYNVGAACVLPYRMLFNAVHARHESAASIAGQFDVSEAYVTYRIRRAGLVRVYSKHHRLAARR